MDTPPPYSVVDHTNPARPTNRPLAESSRAHPSIRALPSAPPVLYNTTSDAKIAYNPSFGIPGMSYLSTPQSFSPPHLPPPPPPPPQVPPLPSLKGVQLPGPSFASSSSSSSPSPQTPPRPQHHQYGRHQEANQSSYFPSSQTRQPRSTTHSPVSPTSPSSFAVTPSPKQDQLPYEKQPRHHKQAKNKAPASSLPSSTSLPRRPSASSISSASSSSGGSTSSWKSSSPKPTCDEKAPRFNNRKSSIEMKGVNKRLDWLQPNWHGKYFSLKTTNAMVDVHGSLDAKSVIMTTTNAKISWKGDSILCKEMDVRTTNAAVEMVGEKVEVTETLKIRTSNAQLIYDKAILLAKDILAVTTNSEIRMRHAHIKRSLSCKTTNAPVNLYIQSIPTKAKSKSPPKINVEVTTTNAPVTIHMPSDFAGEFKLTTSQTKTVTIEDRQNAVVSNQKESVKEGYRSKKSHGSLKVTTTEGNITIYFDQ